MRTFAPIVLRIGLALVLFWFGISQLLDPSIWISILPGWTSGVPFLSHTGFIYLNAIFDLLLGTFLFLGLWTRWTGLLAALHIMTIAFNVGLSSSIGVRDFGLAMMGVSIFLYDRDQWCLDRVFL